MGSLGLTATTMAVRSAFALLCFALLCGLAAASSGFQSETETELRTKIEGEAAGNQILVEQALESRIARGSKKGKRMHVKKTQTQRNARRGRKPGTANEGKDRRKTNPRRPKGRKQRRIGTSLGKQDSKGFK